MPQSKRPQRVVTFLYHEVTDDPTSSGFQRASALPYKHGVEEFARNLDVIAQSGLTPSLVHQLEPWSERPGLMLTFDDGGKSALHISEELDKRGWKGHFFVTTKFIGDRHFLSRSDVRDIHDRGHMIGAHSHSHPVPFYSLTYDQLLDEWRTSAEILAEITRAPVVTGSVPGGDLDENVQRAALEAGLKYLFTSEPTYSPWTVGGLTSFGRVYPLKGTRLGRVADYCRLVGFRRDMMKRRVKRIGRIALGPIYRMMVSRSAHRAEGYRPGS